MAQVSANDKIGIAIQGAGNVSGGHLRAYLHNPYTINDEYALASIGESPAEIKRCSCFANAALMIKKRNDRRHMSLPV